MLFEPDNHITIIISSPLPTQSLFFSLIHDGHKAGLKWALERRETE